MTDSKLTNPVPATRLLGDAGLLEDIQEQCQQLVELMQTHNKDLTVGEFQNVLGCNTILEGVRSNFNYRMNRESEYKRQEENGRRILGLPTKVS